MFYYNINFQKYMPLFFFWTLGISIQNDIFGNQHDKS